MANPITRVTEIALEQDGGADAFRKREYTRAFRCESDVPIVGAIWCFRSCAAAFGIVRFCPYVDAAGNIDYGALAESIQAKPESPDENYNWLVTVKYTSKIWDDYLKALNSGGHSGQSNSPHSGQDDASIQNPLNRPATIRVGSMESKQALDFDMSGPQGLNLNAGGRPVGVAIVNSAGDAFDPRTEIADGITVITVEINQKTFPWYLNRDLKNTINASEFTMFGMNFSFPRGTLLLKSITGESVFEDPYVFWRNVYEFHAKFKCRNGNTVYGDQRILLGDDPSKNADFAIVPWDLDLLDQGTRELLSSSLHVAADAYGTPMPNPVPLDGDGHMLSPAEITARQFEFRAFRRYQMMPFEILNFPAR